MLSVTPQHVRVNPNDSNRAIFMAQPCFVIEDGFAAGEPPQNLVDHGLVDVEGRDMPADVLLCRVARSSTQSDSPTGWFHRAQPKNTLSSVIEALLQLSIDQVGDRLLGANALMGSFSVRRSF
jgi:hypothetical protein